MIKIVYEPQETRAAAYDDDICIGESTYSNSETMWIIDHTEVNENYGGKGIASQLVEELVNQARNKAVKILPLCPFANREFQKKKEYADVKL